MDFTGEHGENTTAAFANINSLASYETLPISQGNWAEQLIKFVEQVKASGQKNAIVNLSFDLAQIDEVGTTTRYEITPEEQIALNYARENNILLVVASGNTGDRMSALGAAAEDFDNIITVGAVNRWEEVTDYSSRGDGLTLVAPGGEFANDPDAFVGTSRAAAYVTGAASLVWAANPELSYQQVKDILMATAQDLGPEGWDADSGAGLLDVTEALLMASLVKPEEVIPPEALSLSPGFSGQGRVQLLERAASAATAAEIDRLVDSQDSLLEQWQILALAGNPSLTLTELSSVVAGQQQEGLDKYEEVSRTAAIDKAQNQQLAEALVLATNHYQIEQQRLEALEGRQQELQSLLEQLKQEKTQLEVVHPQYLATIETAIAQTKKDIAQAKNKLKYQLVDPETLSTDPTAAKEQAKQQLALAQVYRDQAQALATQQNYHQALANDYSSKTQDWVIIGHEKKSCGRTGSPIWGWRTNPQMVALHTQHRDLAGILGNNAAQKNQLAAQLEQQAAALTTHSHFLEDKNQNLSQYVGKPEEGLELLQLLQTEATKQQEIANQYWLQAQLAEKRRKQNQDTANRHNSLINRWEVVGHRRRSCGGKKPIYGWRHYPEHIPPRNQAQQQANIAEAERKQLEQFAQQAQQLADALAEEAKRLEERIEDWPSLKWGINSEINAYKLKLQGEKDLLTLQTPVQKQQLEKLNLEIDQLEAELQTLETSQIPKQKRTIATPEKRWQKLQAEVEASRKEREASQKQLENFLEVSGYLLPYQERKAAIERQIKELEAESVQVQELILQLSQHNNGNLQPQLDQAKEYLEDIEGSLNWAKIQEEQLHLSAAASPQRLALKALLNKLQQRQQAALPSNSLPLQHYIQFLEEVEAGNTNLLKGFNNLSDRLTKAQAEQETIPPILERLKEEYRNLGFVKTDLEKQVAQQQEKLAAKDKEIATINGQIKNTKTAANLLQDKLQLEQELQVNKQEEITNQEKRISRTETKITTLQDKIDGKNQDIASQEAILQDYQQQIKQAGQIAKQPYLDEAAKFEQERIYHQNSANSWNSRIPDWFHGLSSECQSLALGQPQNAWIKQAITNRNSYQHFANVKANQRNRANKQAVEAGQIASQAKATELQPQIEAVNQEIKKLQEEKLSLIKSKNTRKETIEEEQKELRKLQQELTNIAQRIESLNGEIKVNQEQLISLDKQLQNQHIQRDNLIVVLNNWQEKLKEQEDKLADKYQEIELSEQYLEQVEQEIKRLQSRLDLLNQADALEQEYQNQEQQWQEALQKQIAATKTLLASRQAKESDRQLLLSLQSQLEDVQTQLTPLQTEEASLQAEVNQANEDFIFAQEQLRSQQLQLQALIDRDPGLVSAEAYHYNLAQQHLRRIWYWNGRQYIFNSGEAAAYRANLQKASLLADERNRVWQQSQEIKDNLPKLEEKSQEKEVVWLNKQEQLTEVEQKVAPLVTQATNLQQQITPLQTSLAPYLAQEQIQTQNFQTAVNQSQSVAGELIDTTLDQVVSLQRLISFGVLAAESDVDFFPLQVEPKVQEFIRQLQQRSEDLGQQSEQLGKLIGDWQKELGKTSDPASREALENLITQTTAQRDTLRIWLGDNQAAIKQLEERLQQANTSLEALRQQQELTIRQNLGSNEERLENLRSQLAVEEAAANALNTNTVLGYAELNDKVKEDLTQSTIHWTEQFKEGNQQTKNLGKAQLNLSGNVDQLLTHIEDNFADPHGEYHRSHANLRDTVATLGVVAPLYDEFVQGETLLKQEIAKMEQWIKQDAELWEEIAPIVERYGVESEELKAYQQQYQWYKDQDQQLADQFEVQRQQYQNNANYWSSKVRTWGITGYNNWLFGRWPVYGWIHNPQAEANRKAAQAKANEATKERDAALEFPQAKAFRGQWLTENPKNGTAIDILHEETSYHSNTYNQKLAQAQASYNNNSAQSAAAISQADWYEKRAAEHWQRSRKNGPTWQEWRSTWKRGKSGKKEEHSVLVTHIDHDWILWDTYTKYAQQLRQQGVGQLQAARASDQAQKRYEPLAQQWTDAHNAVNQAASPVNAPRNLVESLEVAREQIPGVKEQLKILQELLPEVEDKLQEAKRENTTYQTQVKEEWAEYEPAGASYRQAVADVLQRQAKVNKQAQELQHQLADTEIWVEGQSVALATELQEIKALEKQLIAQEQVIAGEITALVNQGVTVDGLADLQTQQAQIQQILPLLQNKDAVLTAQQTALTQKRNLLTAQNEVINAEQQLINAYLESPDGDLGNLRSQLQDARAALAEAQRLAEQAEASSQALTTPLQELQENLLLQNDAQLQAAKERKTILDDLLEAIEI